MTRIRVLHRGMELTPANSAGEKSTDQRKPFGCAITRYIFPSENKTLKQCRVSNRADKETGNGELSCRCQKRSNEANLSYLEIASRLRHSQ